MKRCERVNRLRLRVPKAAGAVMALALGWAAGVASAQQQDSSKVEIKATKVAGNVFMLEGSGGNIGVSAGPDGLLIVDDQFAPLAEKIRAALKPLSPGKLKFVLNTHWHGDHTGGNPEFGREAPIIAQTNVRKRLESGGHLIGRDVPPAKGDALPVVTFDESLSVWFNGEEIRVLHYPMGHTDGDSVILFTKSNVVHMGDDFFAGRFPFVDLDSGGDVEGLAKNIEQILKTLPPGVKLIPGHGPVSTIDGLKTYQRMLTESIAFVRSRVTAGKTLDQIQAEGLPAEWKSWAWEFISEKDWLGIVHRSVTKK